jgi:spore coat polysaccharide biosynthesis predicted glycosyltransferase SpsG
MRLEKAFWVKRTRRLERALSRQSRIHFPNRQPVFVMMGATDPRGATFDALEALREIRQCEFALIVFSGDGSRKEEILSY